MLNTTKLRRRIMQLLLGLDVGTTALKVALFDGKTKQDHLNLGHVLYSQD